MKLEKYLVCTQQSASDSLAVLPTCKYLLKKQFIISVMVCIILTACSRQREISTVFSSLTPAVNLTATAVATPVLTSTQRRIPPTELPFTPTFTPFPPYRTKNVVFEYYVVGQLSYFDIFYADYQELPKIILYDDGQLLINGEQKLFSTDEVEMFLSKLDLLGFFSIESNQRFDQTDKLYDFGNNYQEVNDGLKDCILVNAERSKKLCFQEDYMQYLIPEMKSIIKYLDEYKPTGLTPYYPDRILLSIRPADPNSDNFPAAIPSWDNRFPSLDIPSPRTYLYDTPPSIIYIEGEMAKEIDVFITNSRSGGFFIQDGKVYKVEVDVVLPHEIIINGYQ